MDTRLPACPALSGAFTIATPSRRPRARRLPGCGAFGRRPGRRPSRRWCSRHGRSLPGRHRKEGQPPTGPLALGPGVGRVRGESSAIALYVGFRRRSGHARRKHNARSVWRVLRNPGPHVNVFEKDGDSPVDHVARQPLGGEDEVGVGKAGEDRCPVRVGKGAGRLPGAAWLPRTRRSRGPLAARWQTPPTMAPKQNSKRACLLLSSAEGAHLFHL